MLPRAENELPTRVGRNTATGGTMRRYWISALLARELAERATDWRVRVAAGLVSEEILATA